MESIRIQITRAKGGNLAYFKIYSVYRSDPHSDYVALVATFLNESMASESARYYNGLEDGVYFISASIVFVR